MHLAALGHFPGVPEEPTAGNIRGGVRPMLDHGLAGHVVQRPHGLGHALEQFLGALAPLQGSGQDAGANGLGQHQLIARLRGSVGDDLVGMDYPSDRHAVLQLLVHDSMPTNYRHPSGGGALLPTSQNEP